MSAGTDRLSRAYQPVFVRHLSGMKRGSRCHFRDAQNEWHEGRLLGGPRNGYSFHVVPVCTEATWRDEAPADRLAYRAWPVFDVHAVPGCECPLGSLGENT